MIRMDAVEYFEFVRDVPFRMALSAGDPDHSCFRKAKVLKPLLESVGLKARFGLFRFSWNDLNLAESVKAIPHVDVVHVCLEVYSKEQARWVVVDPTWDKGLASELPVAEWDGKSDTAIAVKPTKRLDPIESQEELDKFFDVPALQEWLELPMDSPSKGNGRFYQALNEWAEGIRP